MKINEEFQKIIDSKDRQRIERFFQNNRKYLLRLNSPQRLLSTFFRYDLHELVFSIMANFNHFSKRVKPDERIDFELMRVWYYCQLDCYPKALHCFDELFRNAHSGRREQLYTYLASIHFYQEKYKESLEASLIYEPHVPNDQKRFQLYWNMAICYAELGEQQKAEDCLGKIPEALLFDAENRRRYLLCKTLVFRKRPYFKTSEGIAWLKEAIELFPEEKFNRALWFYLGELYQKEGLKEEAIHAYQKAIVREFNNPKSSNAKTYSLLIGLGVAELTLEQKVAALCYPIIPNEQKHSALFFIKQGNILPFKYDPELLKTEDHFDLFAGRRVIGKKALWLTSYQTKLLSYIAAAGEIGIHILQLEWFLFGVIFSDGNTGISRIEKMILELRKMGIPLRRDEQFLYFTFQENLSYVLPAYGEFMGPLALFKNKVSFQRVDVEKELGLKKTAAAAQIARWLKEGKVLKSSPSQNTYILNPVLN